MSKTARFYNLRFESYGLKADMADFPYGKTVIYFRDIKMHQKKFEPLFFGQKMYKWPALVCKFSFLLQNHTLEVILKMRDVI